MTLWRQLVSFLKRNNANTSTEVDRLEAAFYIFFLYILGKDCLMQISETKKPYEGFLTITPSIMWECSQLCLTQSSLLWRCFMWTNKQGWIVLPPSLGQGQIAHDPVNMTSRLSIQQRRWRSPCSARTRIFPFDFEGSIMLWQSTVRLQITWCNVKVTVKQSRYRTGGVQRVPGS